jgi:hypothetical protein
MEGGLKNIILVTEESLFEKDSRMNIWLVKTEHRVETSGTTNHPLAFLKLYYIQFISTYLINASKTVNCIWQGLS